MVKIRKIRSFDRLEDLEWTRGFGKRDFLVCENPKFARVAMVMVSRMGKWHDEIIFIEPSLNVVVVPVHRSEEIYLHEEYRPKVMRESVEIKPKEFGGLKLESLGRWSLEVPRGGFDSKDKNSVASAIREVEEETGLRLGKEKILQVGGLNPNTAYAVATIPVYMAQCDSKAVRPRTQEEQEKIKNGKWYTITQIKDMISNGEIFCGVTLAALNQVLRKLEKN